jgi:integral membrane sensor domain MASE1
MASSWPSEAEATDDAPNAARSPQERNDDAVSAAFVLIIVVALLCVAMLVLFGILWAALHFGVGHDDDD